MSSIRNEILKIFHQSQEPYFDIDDGLDKLRTLLVQGIFGEKVSR